MLVYKIVPLRLKERLELRKVSGDKFGANRVIVVSNQKDPVKASAETYATKEILKKYKAAFDSETKSWWWNDKFRDESELIRLATKATDEANEFLETKGIGSDNEPLSPDGTRAKHPKLAEVIKSLNDIKEKLETSQVSPEATIGKEEVKGLLDKFVHELANAVDDIALSEKLQEYFQWLGKFPQYSFWNKVLIYLQKPDARKVNSKTGWGKLKHTISPTAQQILIWRPTLKPPTELTKKNRKENWIKKNNPNNGPLNPSAKEAMEKYINEPTSSLPFILYPVYDITDVVDENGEVGKAPENVDLKWFGDEEDTPETDALFDAIVSSIKHFKINLKISDEMGGSRGSSSSGTIKLLSSNTGPSKVKTGIHELGHELMHQSYLKALANAGKLDVTNAKGVISAYIGRDSTEVLELQAESVAYVVMRSFGFDIKYSVNYIALWKGTKESILANLQIITNTSNIIINSMNSFLGGELPNMRDDSDSETQVGAEMSENDEMGGDVNLRGHKLSTSEVAELLNLDLDDLDSINESLNHMLGLKKIL